MSIYNVEKSKKKKYKMQLLRLNLHQISFKSHA